MNKKSFNILLIIILLLACIVRIYAYISIRELDTDEFMLLSNVLHRNILTLFLPLDKTQNAPPLFLIINKILSYFIFPNEYSLRIISLLCGLYSIFLFYKLSKKIFTKDFPILISNFLFAINIRLIFYAQEFKQYSLEMMLGLLFILFFSNFNLEDDFSYKKALSFGTLMFLPLLLSVPYIFVLSAFLIYNFIINPRIRKYILVALIPFSMLFLIYYLITLHPSQISMLSKYADFWGNGFISLNLNELYNLIKYNYNYFWGGERFALLHFAMIFLGIFLLAKKKSKINILIILSLFIAILASLLNVYPFKERIILYLVPYFIIFSVAVFDFINFSKKPVLYSLLSACLVLSYSSYNYVFFKSLFGSYAQYQPVAVRARKMPLKYLKDQYKDNEIIVYNDASEDAFIYNSLSLKWNTSRVKSVKIQLSDYSKDFYYKTLDSLFSYLKDYDVFYFYYPMDFSTRPVIPYIKSWLKTNNYKYSVYYNGNNQLFIKVTRPNL